MVLQSVTFQNISLNGRIPNLKQLFLPGTDVRFIIVPPEKNQKNCQLRLGTICFFLLKLDVSLHQSYKNVNDVFIKCHCTILEDSPEAEIV